MILLVVGLDALVVVISGVISVVFVVMMMMITPQQVALSL